MGCCESVLETITYIRNGGQIVLPSDGYTPLSEDGKADSVQAHQRRKLLDPQLLRKQQDEKRKCAFSRV